jgi:hypothetical protein
MIDDVIFASTAPQSRAGTRVLPLELGPGGMGAGLLGIALRGYQQADQYEQALWQY